MLALTESGQPALVGPFVAKVPPVNRIPDILLVSEQ